MVGIIVATVYILSIHVQYFIQYIPKMLLANSTETTALNAAER